ncbi:MAG: hypothetical protein IPN29_12245 [Saprospiraceae bacterium]|nr:hypothetical protein [Saprospiraceae bacterium]
MSTNIDFRPIITKNPSDCTVPNKEKISPDEFVDLFSSLVDTLTPGDVLEVTISESSFRHLLAHSYMKTIANYFNPENGISLLNKKEALDKVESDSLTKAITTFNFSMARFLDGYYRLNEMDNDGHSFRSRVLHFLDNMAEYNANKELVDHIRFLTHEEYNHIISSVEKAATLYELSFKGQHSPDVAREVNETLLNPEMAGALEEIAYDLKNGEVKLREALDARFLAENNAFQTEFYRIYKSCFAFEEKLTLFTSLFGEQDIIKPGMLTLDKGVKLRYDHFQQLRSEGIKLRNDINRVFSDSCPELPAESVTHLMDLNTQCRSALTGWKSVSSNLIEENLSRLNRLNARDPLLDQRAGDIHDCLVRLNELGVFKNHLEFNSPNFIQLQKFAGNLVKKMGEAVAYCRSYPAMVAWKSFYSGLEPISRDLLSRLFNFETSTWLPMVKSAFLRLRIGPYIHPAIIRHRGPAEETTHFFEKAMRLKGSFDLMKVITLYEASSKNTSESRFLTHSPSKDPKLLSTWLMQVLNRRQITRIFRCSLNGSPKMKIQYCSN